MRRCVAVLALLLAACGGSSQASGNSPEEALERFLTAYGRGQHGQVYEHLHPAQQDLFTADQFDDCAANLPTFQMADFEVVDTYEETVTIPGTDETRESVALTFEAEMNGEPFTDTSHLIDEDGEWYAYLTADLVESCA